MKNYVLGLILLVSFGCGDDDDTVGTGGAGGAGGTVTTGGTGGTPVAGAGGSGGSAELENFKEVCGFDPSADKEYGELRLVEGVGCADPLSDPDATALCGDSFPAAELNLEYCALIVSTATGCALAYLATHVRLASPDGSCRWEADYHL